MNRHRVLSELKDGEEFSLDGGKTWLICGMVMWGTVSVYVRGRVGWMNAGLVRKDAPRDSLVLVNGIVHPRGTRVVPGPTS